MDLQLGQLMRGPLKSRWADLRETSDPASIRVLWVLAGLCTLLAVYLGAGPNPWEESIGKRLAAAKPLKLEHFIQIGLWWGAAASFGASLIALATVTWWSRPHTAIHPDLHPPGPKALRWTMIFALAAMILGVWPRMSRLDHSLWNDEEYHLRAYVWGAYQPAADGTQKFEAVSWRDAIFLNQKGNHHVWASVESRLGHALSGHTWDQGSTFSETGLRIVPFISGILTIGVLVLLTATLGGPRLGLAAGLILALHPWHVRWSVEIRGYSTMLLGITAGLYCLLRALQTNRWRWWLGYAATQPLVLLCFAGSVYVIAAQNLVALAVIFINRNPASVKLGSASRLITAGILSFIPTALIMGPHVPQLAAYLRAANEYAPIGTSWFLDLWTHLVSGIRPSGDPAGTSKGIALSDLTNLSPWKSWIYHGLIPLLTAGGLAALLVQDWRTRFVMGTLLLSGAMAVLHNALSGSPFLPWYMLYLLPAYILALVWSAKAVVKCNPRVLASLPLVLVVAYSLLTAPALERIMNVPRQPIRETAAAMRKTSPALTPADPPILTASFGDGARQMLSYDPGLQILKTTQDLTALIKRAVSANSPLFLCLRGPAAIASEAPELLQAVTTDPRWQKLPSESGMEAMLSYDLYRFAPAEIERIQLQTKP